MTDYSEASSKSLEKEAVAMAMAMAMIIPIATSILFAFEIVGLISGRLQAEVAEKPWLAPVVVVSCVLVMAVLGDKLLGSSGIRYMFYGAILLFNASLFLVLWFQGIAEDRKRQRQ